MGSEEKIKNGVYLSPSALLVVVVKSKNGLSYTIEWAGSHDSTERIEVLLFAHDIDNWIYLGEL